MIFFIKNDDATDEFIVAFRKIRYSFNHLFQALDVAFKIFIVFRINFPCASRQFYVFLNEIFYDISLHIKKSTKALTLSNEIKTTFF